MVRAESWLHMDQVGSDRQLKRWWYYMVAKEPGRESTAVQSQRDGFEQWF